MKLLILFYPLVCLLLGTVSGSASWLREAGMHALVVVALAAAFVAGWRHEKWPLVGGLFEPMLVLLFLVLASGALQPPCAGRSWRMVVLVGAATGVFYMVLGGGLGRLSWLVPATGAGAAVVGLAAYLMRFSPRVAVPLGHHNYIAGFLLLHLPLTVGAATAASRRSLRLFWLVAAAIEGLAILLTGSLAGIVVLVLVALPAGLRRVASAFDRGKPEQAAASGRPAGGRPKGRPYGRLYVPAALLILAVVAGSLLFYWSANPVIGGVRHRVSGLVAGGREPSLSLENRIRFLRAGVAMFVARPLVGFGPASVPLVASLYRPQMPGVMAAGEVLPQLHDLPVNVLAETGILGFAAVILLVLAAMGGRSGPAALAIWAYLFFSLSDYQLDLPAILFPLAVVAALAAGGEVQWSEPAGFPAAWPWPRCFPWGWAAPCCWAFLRSLIITTSTAIWPARSSGTGTAASMPFNRGRALRPRGRPSKRATFIARPPARCPM